MASSADAIDQLASELNGCFVSPNVLDYNGEAANVVDAIAVVADKINRVAVAIHDLASAVRERATP